MHLAREFSTAFSRPVSLPDDADPVRLNREPDLGRVHSREVAAVLSREHAFGFDRLPAPAVKAEDPVRLCDDVPAFELGELAAVRLPDTDVALIDLASQRRDLFAGEAHHRTLTLRTGSGFEREAPATSLPCLRSEMSVARSSLGSLGSQ